MCKPRKRFIEILIEDSFANEFDNAMIEWIEVGEITYSEFNFSPRCHLCGAAIYEKNFVIYNVKTQNKLQIGSECIKRFKSITAKYSIDSQSDIRELRRRHSQEQFKLKLIDQYHFICNKGIPTKSLFDCFCNNLIKLLKSYNRLTLLETTEGSIKVLTTVLKRTHFTNAEIERLKLILRSRDKAGKIFVKTQFKKKIVDKYGITK